MLSWISTRLEYLFTIFAISIYMGAYTFIPVVLTGRVVELGGTNPWNTAAMASLLFGTAILAYRHRSAVLSLFLKSNLVNGFVLFAAISAIWSIDPGVTLRRMVPFITCVSFAYYMVARYPMETSIDRLGVACVMMAVISAAVSVAMPSIGSITVTHPGSWNGVFPHKNSLGALTVIGNIVYGWKFWKLKEARARHLSIILFFFFICVMSQSKTSLIASTIGVMAYPALNLLRIPGLLRLWLFFIFGAGAILGLSILGIFWTEILTGLGRDPTLTGRIPLWDLLLTFAAKHPLLGYGYAAFWLEWNPDADYVWKVVQWEAPEAHNAYIDMLLQLGIVGLALATYTLLWILQRSFRDSLADRQSWSSFILVYSFVFMITNMSETLLYRGGDIYCFMMALIYFSLRDLHQDAGVPAVSRKVNWLPSPRRHV